MTLWHIPLPGFLIIANVSGIFKLMSLVLTTAAYLLILCSLGATKLAVASVKSRLPRVISVCILEYMNTRVSRITGCFPQPLKYQDFGLSAPL
jgi:hypothetical protein